MIAREHGVDVLDEVEGLAVEEHVLLLDAERVRIGLAELVVEDAARVHRALARDRVGVDLLHVAENGVGFDLDPPARVEQALDDDGGRRGPDLREHLAVRSRDLLPVLHVRQVDARSHDVREAGTCLAERAAEDLEAQPRLLVGARRADRPRRGIGAVPDTCTWPPLTTARE